MTGFDLFLWLRLDNKHEIILERMMIKSSWETVCGCNQIVFKAHQKSLNLRLSEFISRVYAFQNAIFLKVSI